VRRLVYLCPEGEALDATMLSAHLLVDSASHGEEAPLQSLDLEKNVDALERRVIREALARASGNRTKAAKLLGISRNGLAIKMERFGLA
jgi:transcriptional regulator with PAS, ATPase and Fis domain